MAPMVTVCVNCKGNKKESGEYIHLTNPYVAPDTTPREPIPWWVTYDRPITVTCEVKDYPSYLDYSLKG